MQFLLLAFTLLFSTPPQIINVRFPSRHVRDTTDNYIVIHYDSSPDPKTTFRYLRHKRNSYNYFIRNDGTIYKLIDPSKQANHAGISYWDGKFRMNKYSIGICLQSDGQSPFTENQYTSLLWLINSLKRRYPDITDDRIIGHSDVAFPFGRKQDPGKYFDWNRITPMRHVDDDRFTTFGKATNLLFSIFDVGLVPSTMETEVRGRTRQGRIQYSASIWNRNAQHDSALADSVIR